MKIRIEDVLELSKLITFYFHHDSASMCNHVELLKFSCWPASH